MNIPLHDPRQGGTCGLIVALDQPDLPKAEHMARELAGHVQAFKVGLTLFSAYGPEALLAIGQHGPVFCDLKLHDIPNQIENAASELARHGVWMFTVHSSGGPEMVAAAARASGNSIVAGVTVLTSLDAGALDSVGQGSDPQAQAGRLADLAVKAGAGALVCSPLEAASLRAAVGPDVLLVTPGVRPAGSGKGDQARVSTPAAARDAGADYLVVGRPITDALDPVAAARQITAEITEGVTR